MLKVSLSKPDITNLEKEAVIKILETPCLSLGPKLKEFEEKMARYAGVKYAVGVNSGTSALHLIIKSLGIRKGDEVITTPFSFISSSNCILYEGATPVFADIKSDTFNINSKNIEEKITKKTKAILAVDVFGHPAEWDSLKKIVKKYKLYLIEDSAEAIGAEYRAKKCGSFGDAAIFSFYPNKQITTGEGGMVLTNNKKIANLCRSMANQGRKSGGGKWLEHVRLGYNYRIDELSCALGIVQLKRIGKILKERERVAQAYNKKLVNLRGVKIPQNVSGTKRSWFVYVITLDKRYTEEDRDTIIKEMGRKGIQCSNYFSSIHLQSFYRRMFGYKTGDFPICESVSQRTVALPFYNNLTEKEIDYVVDSLKEAIVNLND